MRLIDADALAYEILSEYGADGGTKDVNTIYGMVINAPTIDAVEVVKCKNCKFYETSTIWDKKQCTFWASDPYEQAETEPNDYCSYGKRKE